MIPDYVNSWMGAWVFVPAFALILLAGATVAWWIIDWLTRGK